MPSQPAPRAPQLADRLAAPFVRFLAIEAASTILLLLAAVVALAWTNSPWRESYGAFWHLPLGISFGERTLSLSLEHWVNDGLMVLFFFLVGMEIKHELVIGALSSRERAMLPLFGALGGMIVPAAIYASLHAGGPAASGWGVPMATDIAFAVAALTVFGRRVPYGLKVFLLALAIVDDLGAVSVIAVFYTHGISLGALACAGGGLAAVFALQRAGVRSYGVYWIAGLGIWFAMLASGVHATVAGVALGLLTPTRVVDPSSDAEFSPIERLTLALHPWAAFFVLPIFALASAGVPIDARALADPLASRVTFGVALGLLVGKPLGITLFAWLAVRSKLAALPPGVGWRAIFAAGILGGVGFTMALFITALAFDVPALASASKIGVLGASVLAAGLGMAYLARALPRSA
jgi:NhaA family Na+:H+ antiporter